MNRLAEFEQRALPCLDAAHNLAFWLVRSRPDAEDIVQDAYLRAFRAFDACAGEDIKPWLLAIVRNLAYRWLATRKRTANVISLEEAVSARTGGGKGAEPAADEASAEDLLVGLSERALVVKALAELPPPFREAIVLREIEGLSYQEIANVAGVPVGTVMSRLSRARAAQGATDRADREGGQGCSVRRLAIGSARSSTASLQANHAGKSTPMSRRATGAPRNWRT
jgi:RNA polymerase sigma-70 factor (ECF subfamily)